MTIHPIETVRRGHRVCVYCSGDLAADRPLYLVTEADGTLVGPFHPECAAKIRLRGKTLKPGQRLAGMRFGRVLDHLAQEELEL
jgi:hypothetical protein